MKRRTKRILIFSLSCMAAGALLTGAGRLAGGYPGFAYTRDGIVSASSSAEPYTMEKTALEDLTSVEIDIDTLADVRILPSDDGHFYLEYVLDSAYGTPHYELTSGKHTLSQGEGNAGSAFFFGSGLNLGFGAGITETSPCVRLYVPSDKELSYITVYSDSGDLEVRGLHAGQASFTASFGDLTLEQCTFASLETTTDSGDIEASDIKTDTLVSENDFGDTSFRNAAIVSAEATASSGDILLEAEGLQTLNGSNDFGDTQIILSEPLSSYTCDLAADFGDIILPDSASGIYVTDGSSEGTYASEGSDGRQITFKASSGDIELEEKQ